MTNLLNARNLHLHTKNSKLKHQLGALAKNRINRALHDHVERLIAGESIRVLLFKEIDTTELADVVEERGRRIVREIVEELNLLNYCVTFTETLQERGVVWKPYDPQPVIAPKVYFTLEIKVQDGIY